MLYVVIHFYMKKDNTQPQRSIVVFTPQSVSMTFLNRGGHVVILLSETTQKMLDRAQLKATLHIQQTLLFKLSQQGVLQ